MGKRKKRYGGKNKPRPVHGMGKGSGKPMVKK